MRRLAESEADELFIELDSYVPKKDVRGEYGIKWLFDERMIDLAYLKDLVKVRRVQFLEGIVSPQGWNHA